jgi:hypothetical protein
VRGVRRDVGYGDTFTTPCHSSPVSSQEASFNGGTSGSFVGKDDSAGPAAQDTWDLMCGASMLSVEESLVPGRRIGEVDWGLEDGGLEDGVTS